MSLDGRSPVLPLPPQATMLAVLACAFEIVAANRAVLPESTHIAISNRGRIRLHVQGQGSGIDLEHRKAIVAKAAEAMGLTADEDRGGLAYSSADDMLRLVTVADGPGYLDRALAKQREAIAKELEALAVKQVEEGLFSGATSLRLAARTAREFRLEVES